MREHVVIGDKVLEQMIRNIVEAVRPTRIILFGSRARGDALAHSDYDLMVEVESYGDYHACRTEIRQAIGDRSIKVDVLVRRRGELEDRCHDPGRMDWDVWRDGVVVYPPGAPPLGAGQPPVRHVRETGAPPASVEAWLERAAEDLIMIDRGLTGELIPWGAVCFHGQQAAEKYLKVLLIQRWKHPPRTHDLDELVGAARAIGCPLPDLATECKLLKDYAVGVRYPEDLPLPSEATGRVVLAAALRIIEVARELLDAPPPRA